MTTGKLDSGFIIYKLSSILFIDTKQINMWKYLKSPKNLEFPKMFPDFEISYLNGM